MPRPKITDATIKFKVTFDQLDILKREATRQKVKVAEVLRQQVNRIPEETP